MTNMIDIKERSQQEAADPAAGDICVVQNGKAISDLTESFQDRIQLTESLVGIIPDTMTLEEAREERLSEI